MVKDPQILIKHIRDSIENIERYLHDVSYETFIQPHSIVLAAVVRELQNIGEASNHIPEEFREHHTNIPWKKIIGMRHHLVHGYFLVDNEAVWDVIQKDIPELRKFIEEILHDASQKET